MGGGEGEEEDRDDLQILLAIDEKLFRFRYPPSD